MNMITPRYPNAALIGGQWVTGTNVFPVLDPATGQEIARVPNLGAKETRDAIDAAQAAFPAWSAKTAKERAGSCAAGSISSSPTRSLWLSS